MVSQQKKYSIFLIWSFDNKNISLKSQKTIKKKVWRVVKKAQ
jgi:hypothetical protein